MSSKLRVIGYGRESTKEQARYGFNLDDQEKKLRQYAEIYYEPGTYNLEIIREEGASAKSLDRPRMNEILAMVRKKQIDVIIIHNLDRLTRQVRDLATLLELFDQNDVSLISITEKIDTKTPMGRFFIFLIVLIAQWEQETISSRTIRGIEESARQGNYALPGSPFGYRRNPEDNHKLVIEESEAAVVKRIFESVAYKDYLIKSLVNEFNQQKVLDRSWSEQTITKILDNKIYYGTFTRFGVEYPDHTVPIIHQQLFDLAHMRLRSSAKLNRREYIYKGLIVCRHCGSIMVNHSGKGRNGDIHHYYQCKHCGGKQISEKAVSDKFGKEFDSVLAESQLCLELCRLKDKYPEMSSLLDQIPFSKLAYDTNIDALVEFYGSTSEEKKKLRRCLRTVNAVIMKTKFEKLSYQQKREFLTGHVSRISYDWIKKKLEINYIDPNAPLETINDGD